MGGRITMGSSKTTVVRGREKKGQLGGTCTLPVQRDEPEDWKYLKRSKAIGLELFSEKKHRENVKGKQNFSWKSGKGIG